MLITQGIAQCEYSDCLLLDIACGQEYIYIIPKQSDFYECILLSYTHIPFFGISSHSVLCEMPLEINHFLRIEMWSTMLLVLIYASRDRNH